MVILLASSSERRRLFFKHLFDKVHFIDPDINEIVREKSFKKDLILTSIKKGEEGFKKFKNSENYNSHSSYLTVGADTIVRVKGKILGKPENVDEWKNYLKLLSGSKQEVWTSVAMFLNDKLIKSFLEVSYVWFRELEDREIEDYISTNEGIDAAGGYKIQGWGIIFISKIKGSYTNIVGFPVEKFLKYYKSLKNR